MASNPGGTGGWDLLARLMTDQFKPGNIHAFSARFKQKHGSDGNGKDPMTTAYKFGHFVDRHGGFLSGTALGQFLIDSGRRRWEGDSLDLLEYAVKHSLTRMNPKQITFTLQPDPRANKARAEIRDEASNTVLKTTAAIDGANSYTVKIFCPPLNARP
jgi:hypothetical protein